MYKSLAMAVLMLPLAGCVVPPPEGAPYPPPYGYPPPGPAAYSDYSYPGYAYNDGSPTLVVGGATWPLLFVGGGWGYWGPGHVWHRAPEGIGRQLALRHPGGVGYRPYGGGSFGRPVGFAPGRPGGAPGGFRPGQQGAFHPGGQPGGFHPGPQGGRPAPGPSGGHGGRREDEHH